LFQLVRLWRNQEPNTHSDSEPISAEWQDQFYSIYVTNGQPERKYFAIVVDGKEVGVCGFNDITETSGTITIILDPLVRGKGIGQKAIRCLLTYAKKQMGLKSIFGTVNCSNEGGMKFWTKMCKENGWVQVMQFGAELT
jgi:RimJ/RimL family protein N-acetyltransferase